MTNVPTQLTIPKMPIRPKKIKYVEFRCGNCDAPIKIGENHPDKIKCSYCGSIYYDKNKFEIH